MKVIPWRRASNLPTSLGFEDFFQRLWPGNGDFAEHLPKVFREGPFPAVNIAESEEHFTITLDCPGLEEEDIQVETMGNQLLISGERKWEEEKKGKEFHRVESQFGKFERSVLLPENARTDSEGIEAYYKKGILTIAVPKLERTPAAKIAVKSG